MSDFQSLDGIVGRLPTTYNSNSKPGELGKDEFLKLMITQLNHQDPMNPMESSQFAAQLAQFTSVEQLSNLTQITEDSFQADMMLAQSINNTMSANIIGKDVKAYTNSLQLTDGNSADISFELDNNVKQVDMTIRNSSGSVVRTITIDEPDIGSGTFEWDGKDDSGKPLADGTFSIEITSTDHDANEQALTPYLIGQVEAVRYGSNGAVLIVAGQQIDFGNVLEIRVPDGEEGDDTNPILSLLNKV